MRARAPKARAERTRAGRPSAPRRSHRGVGEERLARAWLDWLVETRTGYMERMLALPPVERTKDRGASYPSIQDIFLHILDNNVWWLESVPQNRTETHAEVKGPLTESEIRNRAERVGAIATRLARSLTPARLDERYTFRGVQGGGKPYEMSVNLRTVIWHLVEEELQHRGELNALFWQMNVEAPTRAWFSSSLAE